MTTERRYSRYIPLDSDDGTLFATRERFQKRLADVVDNVAPEVARTGVGSLSFLLQGPWGSGKSTALEHIRRRSASRAYLGVGSIEAPLWAGRASARAAVALAVATAVPTKPGDQGDATGQPELFGTVVTLMDAIGVKRAADPHPLGLAAQFIETFQGMAGFGPVCEQWLLERSHGHHFVVFIDDLDRCDPAFCRDILQATAFWTTLGKGAIRFVMAADREHLHKAMAVDCEATGIAPAVALQKYVHVQVDVPPYFLDHHDLARFVVAQSGRLEFPGIATPLTDALWQAWTQSEARYPNGPLAPLLRAGTGLTPRVVVDRINRFHGVFNPGHLDGVSDEKLKLAVIEALWPAFWWQYLERLVLAEAPGDSPTPAEELDALRSRVQMITAIAKPLVASLWEADPATVQQALLAAAGAQAHILDGVDPRLALYLAATPQLAFPLGDGGDPKRQDPAPEPKSPEGRTERTRTVDPPANIVATPHDGDAPEVGVDLPRDVFSCYLLADKASRSADPQSASAHIQSALDLISAGNVARSDAATVGNLALVAERIDDEERALQLHERAMELRPDHWNIAQNFVSFVLDTGRQDLYGRCAALLDVLDGAGAAHRPSRTRVLRLRLLLRTEPASPTTLDRVRQEAAGITAFSEFVTMYRVLQEAGAFEELEGAGRRLLAGSSDPAFRYSVLRLIADGLSDSETEADEVRGAAMYEHLLSSGLVDLDDEGTVAGHAAVTRNLASVLVSLWRKRRVDDLRAHALALWAHMYRAGVSDESATRSFARALSDADREDEALEVLLGRKLTGEYPVPDRPMAELLATPDAWWEGD